MYFKKFWNKINYYCSEKNHWKNVLKNPLFLSWSFLEILKKNNWSWMSWKNILKNPGRSFRHSLKISIKYSSKKSEFAFSKIVFLLKSINDMHMHNTWVWKHTLYGPFKSMFCGFKNPRCPGLKYPQFVGHKKPSLVFENF